jgi:protein-tyrosine phosphatase
LIESIIPLSQDDDLNEVFPNIFVGNISTAHNKDILTKNGITHVISALSGLPELYPKSYEYKTLDLLDNKFQDIYHEFNETNKFIDNSIKNDGKVYVHCMAGRSRSVTIVCAYLMYKYNYTPEEALKLIKEKRQCAQPNEGFMEQLSQYHYDKCNIKNQ